MQSTIAPYSSSSSCSALKKSLISDHPIRIANPLALLRSSRFGRISIGPGVVILQIQCNGQRGGVGVSRVEWQSSCAILVVVILYLLSALGRVASGATIAFAGLCLFCVYILAQTSESLRKCASAALGRRDSANPDAL